MVMNHTILNIDNEGLNAVTALQYSGCIGQQGALEIDLLYLCCLRDKAARRRAHCRKEHDITRKKCKICLGEFIFSIQKLLSIFLIIA